MKPKPIKTIYVGIPCYDPVMNVGLVNLLCGLQTATFQGERAHYRFEVHIGPIRKRPVEYARNLIVGEFLQSKCDALYFIDQDAIPRPESLQMLDVDADLVCGCTLSYSNGGEDGLELITNGRVKHDFDDEFESIVPDGRRIIDVDATGTASLLIQRHVLEDKRLWYDENWTDQDGRPRDAASCKNWAPPVFRTHHRPDGAASRSEDIDFTYRCKKLGYSIKYDFGSSWGHQKPIDTFEILSFAMAYHLQELKKLLEAKDHERKAAAL